MTRRESALLALSIVAVLALVPLRPDADVWLIAKTSATIVKSGFTEFYAYHASEASVPAPSDIRVYRVGDRWFSVYPKTIEATFAAVLWLLIRLPWAFLLLTGGLAGLCWWRRARILASFAAGAFAIGTAAWIASPWIHANLDLALYLGVSVIHSGIAAATVVLAWRLIRQLTPAGRSVSPWLLAAVVFGSFFLYYSKAYTRDLYSVAMMLAVLSPLFAGKRATAMAVFAVMIVTKTMWVILLPVFTLYWVHRAYVEKRLDRAEVMRAVGLPLAAIAAGYGVAFLVNWMTAGDPLLEVRFASNSLGFTFQKSLYGYALTPGRSLFLHFPAALLLIRWRRGFFAGTPEKLALSMAVLAIVGFHGSLTFWDNGWGWGPRYLLPCIFLIGALLAANAESINPRLLAALALAGIAFNLPSWLHGDDAWITETAREGRPYEDVIYSFAHAPVLMEYQHLGKCLRRELRGAECTDVCLFRRGKWFADWPVAPDGAGAAASAGPP